MTRIEIFGQILDHKLILSNRKRLQEDLNQCQNCDVILVIKKRGHRSTAQNSFYWGVVIQEIRLRFKEMGHRLTAEEVHQYLKEKFIPVHLYDSEGTIIATFAGSTTDFNVGEMMDYMNSIIEWAQDILSLSIPGPASKNEIAF